MKGRVKNAGVRDREKDRAAEGGVGGHRTNEEGFDLASQNRTGAERQGSVGLDSDAVVRRDPLDLVAPLGEGGEERPAWSSSGFLRTSALSHGA